jgi:hypothetical protein
MNLLWSATRLLVVEVASPQEGLGRMPAPARSWMSWGARRGRINIDAWPQRTRRRARSRSPAGTEERPPMAEDAIPTAG